MKQDCNVYAEHAKLRGLNGDNETIGQFLDWCHEQGWALASWRDDLTERVDCVYCDGTGGAGQTYRGVCPKCDGAGWRDFKLGPKLMTLSLPISTILAKYFDIDQNRLEDEKRVILEVLRAARGSW